MKNKISFVLLFVILSTLMCFSCKSTYTNKENNSVTETETKQAVAATTFILVRHAEKKIDGSKNPSLTEEGLLRAERLQKMLQSVDITTIYTTDYNRTSQTVAPTAKSKSIEPQIYQPHDKSILDRLKMENAGELILIAGHSNTVPSMVNHLIGTEKYEDLEETDYDNIFMVTLIDNVPAQVLNLKF